MYYLIGKFRSGNRPDVVYGPYSDLSKADQEKRKHEEDKNLIHIGVDYQIQESPPSKPTHRIVQTISGPRKERPKRRR